MTPQGGGYNQFVFGVDGNSGTLVTNTTGAFEGNSFEWSVEYARQFKKINWLSGYGKLSIKTSIDPNNTNVAQYNPDKDGVDAILLPENRLNGVSSLGGVSINPVEVGLRFASYGHFALRSDFLIKAEAKYPFQLPSFGEIEDNSILVYGGVNAYPFRIGSWWAQYEVYGREGIEGTATSPSITDLYVGLSYTMALPKSFGVSLDASWHTNGNGTGDRTAGSQWKLDSGDALLYNGFIRANLTGTWNNNKGLTCYMQLRYEGKSLIETPEPVINLRMGLPMHDIYLRAGCKFALTM